jgi:hypothetical protein
MFERFTAPAVALSAVLMTVPALADVVTLPHWLRRLTTG